MKFGWTLILFLFADECIGKGTHYLFIYKDSKTHSSIHFSSSITPHFTKVKALQGERVAVFSCFMLAITMICDVCMCVCITKTFFFLFPEYGISAYRTNSLPNLPLACVSRNVYSHDRRIFHLDRCVQSTIFSVDDGRWCDMFSYNFSSRLMERPPHLPPKLFGEHALYFRPAMKSTSPIFGVRRVVVAFVAGS